MNDVTGVRSNRLLTGSISEGTRPYQPEARAREPVGKAEIRRVAIFPNALAGAACLYCAVGVLAFALCSAQAADTITVDAAFPGGNILVDKIERRTIHLRQDQRDTEYPWFYWRFRVRGAAGQQVTIQFTQGAVIGPRGPAVSRDGGCTWFWLGAGAQEASFDFAFDPADTEVHFCFGIPYLQEQLQEFLDRHRDQANLAVETLCRSRKDRAVELLRLGRLDGKAEHCVLLTARHHACEMSTGWALEGFSEAVLADTPQGQWIREHAEIWIVPFMDKDGVEDGDQGKLRRPHDPWLDYAGDSLYPAVAALRERVPAWSAGRLRVALDWHSPAMRDDRIYFAGPRKAETAREVDELSRRLATGQTGPLVFDPRDNMPYGQGWNTEATYGSLRSFAQWAEDLPGVQLATTLELPYASVQGRDLTPESSRAFGADVARALQSYLNEKDEGGRRKDE